MSKGFFLIVMLSVSVVTSAKNDLTIEGSMKGIVDYSIVTLCQYSFEDIIIAKTTVNSNKCIFKNLPPLNDGIYQIIINRPIFKNNQNNYFFNLIIDNSEGDIQFCFDPENNPTPTFTKSKSNRRWCEFLKLQKFRLAAINEIKLTVDPNTKGRNFKNGSKDILEKEIQELKDLKNNFIASNLNKWSTYMVKYDLLELSFEEANKATFWSKFDTSNPDLINTPIYQELIRYYVMSFCGNCNKEQYKFIFQEIIDVFSNNNKTKEWAIQYVISGMQSIENKSTTDFLISK